MNYTFGRTKQAGNDMEQSRLAAARPADDRECLARVRFQLYPTECLGPTRTIAVSQLFHPDTYAANCHRSIPPETGVDNRDQTIVELTAFSCPVCTTAAS